MGRVGVGRAVVQAVGPLVTIGVVGIVTGVTDAVAVRVLLTGVGVGRAVVRVSAVPVGVDVVVGIVGAAVSGVA